MVFPHLCGPPNTENRNPPFEKKNPIFFFLKGVSVTPYFKPHLQLLGIKFLPSKWTKHKFGLSIAPPFTPYQDFVRGSKTEKKKWNFGTLQVPTPVATSLLWTLRALRQVSYKKAIPPSDTLLW